MRRLLLGALVSIAVLTACSGTNDPGDAPAATARLDVTAIAGPACPVQTDPPSPQCAPRPVDSAMIAVNDPEGNEVARGTTGPNGRVIIEVPAGELRVVPQPVEGLLGTAEEITVTPTDGQTIQVVANYDTGIR